MKKYFSKSLLTSFIIATVFSFGAFFSTAPVSAASMSISDFIELLITVGVVPADRVEAVRALAVTLSQTAVAPVIAPAPTGIISTSTSYLQVLTPNGGESWEIDLDVPYTVTWGSAGLNQVRMAFVSTTKSIGTCEISPSPFVSRNGDNKLSMLLKTTQCYNLTTGSSTPLKDGTYKLRVYYTDTVGTTISDESNATFKITPKLIPSIKVTYPNGGEQLVRNREYQVKYKLTNVTNVVNNLIYLYLFDSDGNIAYNSHKTKRTDSTYSLDLPSSLSAGAYTIKLMTTVTDEKVAIEDTTDNFFWISTGL